MNNLVEQQGCAGSGVTGFIPTGRLFSYQREAGKETRICRCWKGDLRLYSHLYSPFCFSCPHPPKTMAFPFHCCVTVLQCSISLVHGHYYLRGYRDLCSASNALNLSFNARHVKRIKLFCTREWQDEQITRKWESLPCTTTFSVQQLLCHPRHQGMQVPERLICASPRDCDFTHQLWESASPHQKKPSTLKKW